LPYHCLSYRAQTLSPLITRDRIRRTVKINIPSHLRSFFVLLPEV
jgi:hypothetical protein